MDPQEGKQSQKKLADLRKQMTPGGDDDDLSDEEVYSEEEISEFDDTQNKSKLSKNDKISEVDQEQKWQDQPNREHGQSMTLQPLQGVLAEQAKKQGQEQVQQNKEEENQWDKQIQQNKQAQKKAETQTRGVKRERSERSERNYDQQSQYKCVTTPYDSKFVFAAYYLLRQQISEIAKANQCQIKLHPYFSSKFIKVYGKDEKKCKQVAEKVDDSINDIQVIQMGKYEAQSGIQLSYKYLQQLLKQKITFFKDTTQNYKTSSYYICGKVSNKILYQKISEIKNTRFTWVHLFRYQNTRSYRAILRKVFDTPQIHTFTLQKFKARQIQVSELKRDFPFPSKQTKRGVLILLTYHGEKRTTIHQQIEQTISTFIRETFSIFCFIFKRNKQSYMKKYTPKIDKVTMFFIAEKATNYVTSYLYIMVKNSDFNELREKIITEVESMKLLITGRRFFKNIYPTKETFENLDQHWIFHYPRNYPYSWSVRAKKGSQFDWKQQFKI